MRRYYETQEEQEANEQGHKDMRYNRRDYDHDKYGDEPEDVAYWQGRRDEETKMRIEEEERQMEAEREQREFERQMHEEEIRQMEAEREQREFEKQISEEDTDQQAVSDFDALMEREQYDMESQDEDLKSYYHRLPDDTQSEDDERPITEEDILGDERHE